MRLEFSFRMKRGLANAGFFNLSELYWVMNALSIAFQLLSKLFIQYNFEERKISY